MNRLTKILRTKHKNTKPMLNHTEHLYVTRRATKEFQELVGGGFETARRTLTETLLLTTEDPEYPTTYLAAHEGQGFRALTVPQSGLLVVTRIIPIPGLAPPYTNGV